MRLKNSFFSYLKENKKISYGIIFICFGLALIFAFGGGSDNKTEKNDYDTLNEYKVKLEEELTSLCENIDGVGSAKVYITFSRGAYSEYSGSKLVETKPPEVVGITVICKGADNSRVKSEVTDMMSALFGIGSNRIAVLPYR